LEGFEEEVLGLSGQWQLAGILRQNVKRLVDTAIWMQPNYHVDPQRLRDVALATKRAGVWNCPTLVFIDVWLNKGIGELVDAAQRMSFAESPLGRLFRHVQDINFQLVKALHEAGVPLLAGTDQFSFNDDIDVPPGFAIHRELELLVQAGLTPYQALESATRNVAVFLGTVDSVGTVAVGKRADLVLLGENPLKDIRATTSLAGVMVGGRWLPRTAIDARLDAWQTYPRFYQTVPHDLTVVRNALWRKPALR
jgi:hypothetical protein